MTEGRVWDEGVRGKSGVVEAVVVMVHVSKQLHWLE